MTHRFATIWATALKAQVRIPMVMVPSTESVVSGGVAEDVAVDDAAVVAEAKVQIARAPCRTDPLAAALTSQDQPNALKAHPAHKPARRHKVTAPTLRMSVITIHSVRVQNTATTSSLTRREVSTRARGNSSRIENLLPLLLRMQWSRRVLVRPPRSLGRRSSRHR